MTFRQKYRILKDAIYTLKDHVGYQYKLGLNEHNFYYVAGQYWAIKFVEQVMTQIELSDKTYEEKFYDLELYIFNEHDNIVNCTTQQAPSRNGRIFILEALLTTINTLEKGE